jgi:hypothetical protein
MLFIGSMEKLSSRAETGEGRAESCSNSHYEGVAQPSRLRVPAASRRQENR